LIQDKFPEVRVECFFVTFERVFSAATGSSADGVTRESPVSTATLPNVAPHHIRECGWKSGDRGNSAREKDLVKRKLKGLT